MSAAQGLLFCTGVARSGSNLLCRMLSAHSQMMVAADPYLPLFRAWRNAIVGSRGGGGAWFDPSSPFHDYYFAPEHLTLLDWIQDASVDLPFTEDHAAFLERCRGRMSLEAADLVPLLPQLPGPTFREVFDNALNIVVRGRNAASARWAGYKEVWTIEFCAPLLRSYPGARFVVILRDPRATVASMLALGKSDATQIAHVLSYARHWRKYVALISRYRELPELRDRVHVTTYEGLVAAPEATARELCRFLGVDFEAAMLEADAFFDHSTGATWRGNSSFSEIGRGIDRSRVDRWRTSLDPRVVRLIEFVCGPEMAMAGYAVSAEAGPHPEILDYLIESNDQPVSWRSDSGDPVRDYGLELVRHGLLAQGGPVAGALARRCFLFEEVFRSASRQRG